jgi:hypothetical protein
MFSEKMVPVCIGHGLLYTLNFTLRRKKLSRKKNTINQDEVRLRRMKLLRIIWHVGLIPFPEGKGVGSNPSPATKGTASFAGGFFISC